jgi:hypothetical protein
MSDSTVALEVRTIYGGEAATEWRRIFDCRFLIFD